MTQTTRLTLACPHCGKVNDRHTDMRGSAIPKDGDIAICIDCGELAVFNVTEGCLRLPTPDEQRQCDGDIELAMYRAAWRAMKEQGSH